MKVYEVCTGFEYAADHSLGMYASLTGAQRAFGLTNCFNDGAVYVKLDGFTAADMEKLKEERNSSFWFYALLDAEVDGPLVYWIIEHNVIEDPS